MSITPRGMSVQEAYRLYRDGKILVNRRYQRKLVWTIPEKEKLIGSLLKGYPIPLILLAERPKLHDSGHYEVRDGMQRLNAIFSFIENLFSYKNKYFEISEFARAQQLVNEGFLKPVSKDRPRLSRVVNPKKYNPIPTAFYTIFMAFFSLMIDREAAIKKQDSDEYQRHFVSKILDSSLSEPLKVQLYFDTINYKGYSVIRITIPSQDDVSFVEDRAFTRKGASTVEVSGPQLLAVYKLFQKKV